MNVKWLWNNKTGFVALLLCRAPGLPPSGRPRAAGGAAASPKGHHQQTPEPQLGGYPQHSWNCHRHGQRWAVMTSSPSNTHIHQLSCKTYQLLLRSSSGLFSVSAYLIPPLPPLDSSPSWTFTITTSPLSFCLTHTLSPQVLKRCFWHFLKLQSITALQKSLKGPRNASACVWNPIQSVRK